MNLRLLLPAIFVAGCAAITPQQAAGLSDATLCEAQRWPAIHEESARSVAEEIARRRIDCRAHTYQSPHAPNPSLPATCSSTIIGSSIHTTCH